MPSNQYPIYHNIHLEPQPEPTHIKPLDYNQQLAAAFGIVPSTKDKFPPHIDDMIKSIYDQTT